MKSIGIVAEYNPFHLGHEFHIQKSRTLVGENSAVIAVMSGDYVQRGEAALMNKYVRAEAACRCGADCVFELPLPWATATAEIFARGAVGVLDGLGVTDLSFGTENDDLGQMRGIAHLLGSAEFTERLRRQQSQERGIPYAEMRENLAQEWYPEAQEYLKRPNNTLAVEYLKALELYGSKTQPHAVMRIGAGHDETTGEAIQSASEIRCRARRGEEIRDLVPPPVGNLYSQEKQLGRLQTPEEERYLARLLMMSKEEMCQTAYCGGGLGEALFRAVHTENSLEQIIEKITCKTYTRARVRRAVLAAVLGNKTEPGTQRPGYARLLACTEKGRAWMKEQRGETQIPILTKSADIRRLREDDIQCFELTSYAHDFYQLGYRERSRMQAGEDWTYTPKVL